MPANSTIRFLWNHQPIEIDFNKPGAPRPSTTVLNWLRHQYTGKGTKEGCAEGDCGACTVVAATPDQSGVMHYRAVNSCLIFLPWLHGRHLITVEGLASNGNLHPVQQAIIDLHGTQCGFCTPGILMSLFALFKSGPEATREKAIEAMSGNLCRCTGYEPILEAAFKVMNAGTPDQFSERESMVAEILKGFGNTELVINHPEQKYMRPAALSDAIAGKQANPQAMLFCGGTDTALNQTKKFIIPTELLDISRLPELTLFAEEQTHWTLGAALPLEDIHRLHKGAIPLFDDLLHVFASKQIRELATLGGNLGTASPIGDTWPVLMALEASVNIMGMAGSRELAIGELLSGYRTTRLAADEIIVSVKIPKPAANRRFRFLKLSKRRQMDISTASVAIALETGPDGRINEVIIALGGMADQPKRAVSSEKILKGHIPDESRIEKACLALANDFSPIDDARASASGRMILAQNGLKKGLSEIVNF